MAVLDWISPDSGPAVDADRIRLRAPRMADYADWARLREVSRAFLQPWEPTWPSDDLTRTAFRRRLALYQRDQDLGVGYAFFVFRKDDGALVGGITLRNILRGVAQTGTLGYWIGEPHARRGYTLEAVNALCRHAFGRLDLHRLEGQARGYLKIDGKWRDHVLFGLVQGEA